MELRYGGSVCARRFQYRFQNLLMSDRRVNIKFIETVSMEKFDKASAMRLQSNAAAKFFKYLS